MTLALAIFASLGFAIQDASGTVSGVVRDVADGRPIAGAEIVLVGSDRSALTDRFGRYALGRIPRGERRLRATHLGFSPLAVDLTVPEDGRVTVDFHLRGEVYELPPVAARVAMTPRVVVSQPERFEDETVPARALVGGLDTSPGVAELGIGAGARALLGPDPPAPDNVLYVRGAGASLDLVLLDGAPVHAPFHLGGLVSPGLPPPIQRARRLQGGVTARYDGGLSDVLILDTRSGAPGVQASAFVDMLAAGGMVEMARSDLGAIVASFRSLHGSWENGLLPTGFPQRYSDALLRADLLPGESDTLSLTLFHNEESVRFDGDPSREAPRWGNAAGSLRYSTPSTLGRLELGGALGSFDTRLPVGTRDLLIATGTTRRARVWADVHRQLGATRVGYGIQGERLQLRTHFRERERATTAVRLRQRADAGAVGLWLEGQRALLRDVELLAGLRANFFSGGLGASLSPRFGVGWQVNDALLLRGSLGRFHQLVVTVDTELPLESTVVTTEDGRVLGTVLSRVAAARSTHLVVGATFKPRPHTLVRLDGFWKTSTGVPEFGVGSLRNAGVDVLASRRLAPGLTAWGAYTLGWAWADYPDAANQTVYDGRHFLRGGITFDAPSRVRLDADLSMGTGLEFGAVPRSERSLIRPAAASTGSDAVTALLGAARPPVEPPNGVSFVPPGRELSNAGPTGPGGTIFTRAPDGSYLRLNLQATAELEVKVFGRTQELLPYFRIVNALDRRDALFFRYDGDEEDEPSPIGSVPILPVVGFEWRL